MWTPQSERTGRGGRGSAEWAVGFSYIFFNSRYTKAVKHCVRIKTRRKEGKDDKETKGGTEGHKVRSRGPNDTLVPSLSLLLTSVEPFNCS